MCVETCLLLLLGRCGQTSRALVECWSRAPLTRLSIFRNRGSREERARESIPRETPVFSIPRGTLRLSFGHTLEALWRGVSSEKSVRATARAFLTRVSLERARSSVDAARRSPSLLFSQAYATLHAYGGRPPLAHGDAAVFLRRGGPMHLRPPLLRRFSCVFSSFFRVCRILRQSRFLFQNTRSVSSNSGHGLFLLLWNRGLVFWPPQKNESTRARCEKERVSTTERRPVLCLCLPHHRSPRGGDSPSSKAVRCLVWVYFENSNKDTGKAFQSKTNFFLFFFLSFFLSRCV